MNYEVEEVQNLSNSSSILVKKGVKITDEVKKKYSRSDRRGSMPETRELSIMESSPPRITAKWDSRNPNMNISTDSGVHLSDETVELQAQLMREQNKNLNIMLETERMKVEHTRYSADMESKLNKALRGTTFGDVSSETTLILLEKSLKGKRIISEEDFISWEAWKSGKRIKLAMEDVNKKITEGLTALGEDYSDI